MASNRQNGCVGNYTAQRTSSDTAATPDQTVISNGVLE